MSITFFATVNMDNLTNSLLRTESDGLKYAYIIISLVNFICLIQALDKDNFKYIISFIISGLISLSMKFFTGFEYEISHLNIVNSSFKNYEFVEKLFFFNIFLTIVIFIVVVARYMRYCRGRK